MEGATGDLDTNYEGKVRCALDALAAGDDFAAVHIEAPDEMAHAGDLGRKLEAIQNVESRVVAPILSELTARGEDFRLLLLSDHPTLLTTRTHDGSPVPYAIYDSRTVAAARAAGKPAPVRKFCEEELASEPVLMDGTDLMKLLLTPTFADSLPRQAREKARRTSAGSQVADKSRGAGGSSPFRGLGQSPKALCRSILYERCERLKGARNATFSKIRDFSTV